MSGGAMGEGAVNGGAGGIAGAAGGPGVPGAADGPPRGWVVVLVCGVLPAALLAAIVAVPAALWSRLPARVADHWTLAGTANGAAPRLVAVMASGALALLGAGLVWLGWRLATRRAPGWLNAPRRSRGMGSGAVMLVPVGVFVMAISAGSVLLVVAANLGGGGLRSASVGYGPFFGLVGGPALLAFLAGYALRRFAGLGAADNGAASGQRPEQRAAPRQRRRRSTPSPGLCR